MELIGSSAAPKAFFENVETPTIKEGFYFHYARTFRFRSGTEEGVPEKFKLYPDPSQLDPEYLKGYLKSGLVIGETDGTLVWQVGDEMPPIGPVESVTFHKKE